jgi:hypothetical protein
VSFKVPLRPELNDTDIGNRQASDPDSGLLGTSRENKQWVRIARERSGNATRSGASKIGGPSRKMTSRRTSRRFAEQSFGVNTRRRSSTRGDEPAVTTTVGAGLQIGIGTDVLRPLRATARKDAAALNDSQSDRWAAAPPEHFRAERIDEFRVMQACHSCHRSARWLDVT